MRYRRSVDVLCTILEALKVTVTDEPARDSIVASKVRAGLDTCPGPGLTLSVLSGRLLT